MIERNSRQTLGIALVAILAQAVLLAGCGGSGTGGTGSSGNNGGGGGNSITDLGGNLAPQEVNNQGYVLGNVSTINNTNGVLRSPSGTMTNLLALNGTASSFANGFNNSNVAVGFSAVTLGDNEATLWSGGAPTELPLLGDPNFAQGAASFINSSGQIVGSISQVTFLNSEALYWASFTAKPVAITPLNLTPMGLNKNGLMVGAVAANTSVTKEFYELNVTTGTVATDLHFSNSNNLAGGIAVNDSGTIVCDNGTNNDVYEIGSNGASKKITTNMVVNSINNQGDVVGDSAGSGFIYTNSKGMVNLNSLLPQNSGWTVQRALWINDNGQVIGYGSHGGNFHAFLLQLPSGSF
jgi:hypothetical protein